MAELRLTDPRDSLKMIRETLCVAQQTVGGRHDHSERIQRMINEIDRQRPLAVDGKHGNRHTATCGCEESRPVPVDVSWVTTEPAEGTPRWSWVAVFVGGAVAVILMVAGIASLVTR